jgi:LPPG:FO 2-phospho-L-lactate transferase
MADEPVRTQVRVDEGWLEFQEYFVHRRQAPDVLEIRFAEVAASRPTPEVAAALATADAIVVCPSNPLVSVGPILAVPGMREAIAAARGRGAPVLAVSPIIGGRALKGPADRMLASLGHEATALGVARLYADLADVFVLDTVDAALAAEVEARGVRAVVADTIMTDDASRARLAATVLETAGVPYAVADGPTASTAREQ